MKNCELFRVRREMGFTCVILQCVTSSTDTRTHYSIVYVLTYTQVYAVGNSPHQTASFHRFRDSAAPYIFVLVPVSRVTQFILQGFRFVREQVPSIHTPLYTTASVIMHCNSLALTRNEIRSQNKHYVSHSCTHGNDCDSLLFPFTSVREGSLLSVTHTLGAKLQKVISNTNEQRRKWISCCNKEQLKKKLRQSFVLHFTLRKIKTGATSERGSRFQKK